MHTHIKRIIPQITAIAGFQTEMATKRQNLRTAALKRTAPSIQVILIKLLLDRLTMVLNYIMIQKGS